MDLDLLHKMGVHFPTDHRAALRAKPRPTIRTVGLAVVASIRMRKMQAEWRKSLRLQESLARKFEGMRRQSRRSGGVTGVVR